MKSGALDSPKHVAIIMDGNGRWAKAQGFRRNFGHEKGGGQVKSILKAAKNLGVEQLTLYAFSTENWNRPKAEVLFLNNLLVKFLKTETAELNEENVRFETIGDLNRFPARVQKQIALSKEVMSKNTGIVLCLALNYGSRAEIIQASEKYAEDCLNKEITPGSLDEEKFSSYLHTSGMPELDILIRTAGEHRISNFLLWQLSYAELFFVDVFWPDFTPEHLKETVTAFSKRDRRYGGLK